jgi:hypothetical protein
MRLDDPFDHLNISYALNVYENLEGDSYTFHRVRENASFANIFHREQDYLCSSV